MADDRDAARSALPYLDSWWAFRQRYLRVPGVQAAVLLGDEVALSTAHGCADLERGVPLTPKHLFHVASHSKTFTATAVLQLQEQGRLRLDDEVGAWLPELREDGSPVADRTLRELLSHAGGLTRDGLDGDHWQLRRPFPDAAGLRDLAALPQTAATPANSAFKYSNIGFGLLGLVVEAASGVPWDEYVRTNVIDRLGLTDTGPDHDPARDDEYATGYSALAYAETRVPVDHVGTGALAAATGVWSTAGDLCRYVAAHLPGDDRLLGEAAKRLMQHTGWEVGGMPGNRYGLGLAESRVGEHRVLGHGGGWPGHITRTLADPEERLAVSVLTNAVDGPALELANGAVALLDLAGRLARDRAGAGDVVDEATADRFRGRYANLWGVTDVALLGGRLVALNPAATDPTASFTELEVVDAHTLRMVEGPGYGSVGEDMVFEHAADGSVTSLRGSSGTTLWPFETFRLPDRVGPGSLWERRPPGQAGVPTSAVD